MTGPPIETFYLEIKADLHLKEYNIVCLQHLAIVMYNQYIFVVLFDDPEMAFNVLRPSCIESIIVVLTTFTRKMTGRIVSLQQDSKTSYNSASFISGVDLIK